MLSVTQRIKTVSQPRGGYVPKSLFKVKSYDDNKEIYTLDVSLSSIQGMAVDYLTRFMLSGDKMTAFEVPILGAKKLDDAFENDKEYLNAMVLLNGITGLDRNSVVNSCKIVCYDVVFRKGIKFYQPSDDVEYSDTLFENVPILVNRCLAFLELAGPVVMNGFTFEGGYTKLVSSGDGDYLTKDNLIDIKTSNQEMNSKWSLQLLMYYILGIHSDHEEFSFVKRLCIYNPLKNQSYTCQVSEISDKSKYQVSHDVLGYKMLSVPHRLLDKDLKEHEDYSIWKEVDGSDNEVYRQYLTSLSVATDFNVDKYEDGIFNITLEDYWTFLKTTFEEYATQLRPKFRFTSSVRLIKRNGYYMFVSISPKGKHSLLHGARLHSLEYPLEYYYDNIERYSVAIITRFSEYWDALRIVSDQIKSLKPTEKYLRSKYSEYLKQQKIFGVPKSKRLSYDEWYEEKGCEEKCSGRVHGCIVDIDWFNHIYLNPYDGTITPYNAASMFDKNVYMNTRSLLSAQRPEMLPAFDKLIEQNKTNSSTALLMQNQGDGNPVLAILDDEISKEIVKVHSLEMYGVSNRLKPLQNIYDRKLVQIWYNEVIDNEKPRINSNNGIVKKNYISQTRVQKNGLIATVIRYQNYQDIDVQFEDGVVVEHVTVPKWQNGTIQHPNIKIEKDKTEKQKSKKRKRDKYIGMTLMMNCGLKATVIDYVDCKNVTLQFEDGLIKSGVRSDHFMAGKVSHTPKKR